MNQGEGRRRGTRRGHHRMDGRLHPSGRLRRLIRCFPHYTVGEKRESGGNHGNGGDPVGGGCGGGGGGDEGGLARRAEKSDGGNAR